MGKEKGKKVRIKDIAERAGVSTGTVDRVLHKRGEVNDATRAKIMLIVDELGYTPNIIARSLASKKTARLVVLFPDPKDNNPYWELPFKGISKGIKELKDYNVEVEAITFTASDENSFVEVSKAVLASNPDGVVFNPVHRDSSLAFIHSLEELSIPYIFFDINIKDANCLSYFGQDAFKSGVAAARLMHNSVSENSKILVVNLANNKLVPHHLKTREEGFFSFFNSLAPKQQRELISVKVDLLDLNEPGQTLTQVFKQHKNIEGIFAPNSRVFKVADFLRSTNNHKKLLIGYDIIEQNAASLDDEVIDYLICQKPEEQAYKAIMAMFSFIVTGVIPDSVNYSPIDVIFKENIHFYRTFK